MMPTDAESHDDVAGLFKRLGRRDSTPQYHDFSPAVSEQAPVQRSAPPPVPAPPPVAAEPQRTAEPLPTPVVDAAPAPHADTHAVATGGTPLAALFARLAAAPLSAAAQSPLARLRQR